MNSSKKKKKLLHFGGFACPLYCNGSEGGITTKRKDEVTCKVCKRIIKSKEKAGFIAVSGEFRWPACKNGTHFYPKQSAGCVCGTWARQLYELQAEARAS